MKSFRAEIVGVGEGHWTANGLEFPTAKEAEDWVRDLAMRWSGFDVARVVPSTVERLEAFDPDDPQIVLNYRRSR